MIPRPAGATLFPYTTLFRSQHQVAEHDVRLEARDRGARLFEPRGRIDVPALFLEYDGEEVAKRGFVIDDEQIHGSDSSRPRSEEHTSELQSQSNLVCRLLLE